MNDQVKAEIRERYDRFAAPELEERGTYEELNAAKVYFRRRKLETALALGDFPPGGRVLEVGSSVGQYSFQLAKRGFDVTAADLSANAVAVGQRRAAAQNVRNVSFVVADAEQLSPLADNTFDGVVSFSTLRYVPNLHAALAEIRRVLKPGGTAVLDFPNRYCPWFYVKQWLGSERHPHDHQFSAGTLRRLVASSGLQVTAIRHLLFTPTLAPAGVLPLFKAVDAIGERLPLVDRLAAIVMVAARK